jgi:hypothetical protein
VDGLADRTLDSLKACGFDKGRWGDAPVERWRLRHHQRAALAASRRQGAPPSPTPRSARGFVTAKACAAAPGESHEVLSKSLPFPLETHPELRRWPPAIESGL